MYFVFSFFLAEAAGSAAAVSSFAYGCEEAIVQRVVRRGSELFLHFVFSFFLAEVSGSAAADSPPSRGCEEALSSMWVSSRAGTVFTLCFQFLSGRGIRRRRSC